MRLTAGQHLKNSILHNYNRAFSKTFRLTTPGMGVECGINTFTSMPPPAEPTAKTQALKAAGTFNPRAHHVRHPLFAQSQFFDPHDLPQLKYEALRALQHEAYSMTRAAAQFGLSRPTLYQAQAQLAQAGLEGLLPRKRGPKKAHKLTPQVRQHLQELAAAEPGLNAQELARRLHHKFKVRLHPRTLQKALQPKAKRGRQSSP